MKEENSEREGCNYKDKNCSCSKMFLGEEEIKSSTLKKKNYIKKYCMFFLPLPLSQVVLKLPGAVFVCNDNLLPLGLSCL